MLAGFINLIDAAEKAGVMAQFAILIFGFALGAWGQAARFRLATALGLALIMAAVVLLFLTVLGGGSGGIPDPSG